MKPEAAARARDTLDLAPRFTEHDAVRLNRLFRGASTEEMLTSVIRDNLAGDLAVVSSFGAESAVLLHLVALIDRRTTLIILGDGRSNYDDPRTDLFRDFAARAKRTIWLNPEPMAAWGSGDSEIPRYRPYCSTLSHVATLKDLERAVDDVLSAYS